MIKRQPVSFSAPIAIREVYIGAQKDPEQDYLGTWVFEGRLTFSKGFIGRWRSSSSRDISNAHGIFSMAKISK